MDAGAAGRAHRALDILCKWRAVFAGWQLGSRLKGDPESDAVRDHRELSILLRVELSALTGLLLRQGVLTEDQLHAALEREARDLNEAYERRFPGVTAHEHGLTINVERAMGWMKDWRP